MTQTCYSYDECEFRYDSAEEAAEACASNGGEKPPMDVTVYEGEATFGKASDFAPDIIDHLGEQAYDRHGEFSEFWPDVSKEDAASLQAQVETLIDKFFDEKKQQPNFGSVKQVREIQVHVDADWSATIIDNKSPGDSE